MASRRRTRWYDVIIAPFTLEGDAAGETVMTDVVTTSQIENDMDSRATLIRVVGDIFVTQTLGSPLVDLMLSAGVVRTFGAADFMTANDYEDMRTIWMGLWTDDPNSSTVSQSRIPVDVRTKRKLLGNNRLQFIASTNSIAGQDSLICAHLRALFLLS